MKSNSFTEIIPIFIVFKAMGLESEQVIYFLEAYPNTLTF